MKHTNKRGLPKSLKIYRPNNRSESNWQKKKEAKKFSFYRPAVSKEIVRRERGGGKAKAKKGHISQRNGHPYIRFGRAVHACVDKITLDEFALFTLLTCYTYNPRDFGSRH